MSIKVLYFASLQDFLMRGQDDVTLPEYVHTVEELMNYLSENNQDLKKAFETMPRLRCAVNQELATKDTKLKDGDEVAFFPPVTGG